MTVALEIKNVSHKFGEFTALDDVSLNINSGDFTVLLGLNGAGKTTLYSLITRLYNNNSGSIQIYGFDVREDSVNRRQDKKQNQIVVRWTKTKS